MSLKNILIVLGECMHIGIDLSIEEYAKDFEKLGCTHEEAIELVNSAMQPVTIDTSDWDRLVEEFNNIGLVNPLSPDEVRKALERYKNESN
jgi:hypothetical protein